MAPAGVEDEVDRRAGRMDVVAGEERPNVMGGEHRFEPVAERLVADLPDETHICAEARCCQRAVGGAAAHGLADERD